MEDRSAQDALREAVDAVYAVAPADFVATRKEWVARVRAAGHRDTAKEVGALRKPSVSAAAVNALVRAEDPVLDRLRDIGTRLRHSQSAMDAAGMTALRGERDALLTEWVAAARRHATGPLAASTEAEVRDTAVAALADAHASEVVLSGSMTRSLAYSGFGEVDVADAVARTSTGVVLTRIEGGADAHETVAGPDDTSEGGSPDAHEAEVERLREELESAEALVTTARETRRETEAVARSRRDDMDVAAAGVEQAERLLAQAERHAATAQDGLDQALEAQQDADRALEDARTARDAARRRLEEAQDAG